ncbi:hypothetical protein J3R83DRAFT_5197 [Lanmaoa asiatica]|nr:hypothetical protein J3R83DRAFT_5197 [Lanmaoa asiatica]
MRMKIKSTLSQTDVIQIHNRVTRLPPARFANRRLYLPCIIFAVKTLSVQDFGSGQEYRYHTQVSGIGDVEFKTLDKLSLTEPRKLAFVHPWIRDLRDPFDGLTWQNTSDLHESESHPGIEAGSTPTLPLHPSPPTNMDSYTRALRLVVRLRQPFNALLLQQQPNGEFKRVATEHEIIAQLGLEHQVRDIRTEVVEIL